MSGWMDSSCLAVGESNRKGGVAELETCSLEERLILLTTEGVYSKSAPEPVVLSCHTMSACHGLHHNAKEAVLVFPGRSKRGILPLPASP